MQAAPPWYASAWNTFVGRLSSDQPLISDPRGSTSFQAGGKTYVVPNTVRDDTASWVAGNLYNRPLFGDVIGAVEAPLRALANPQRYATAAAVGVVNTVSNVPRLPEIWSQMPDYQRQDMAVRMLAAPYFPTAGMARNNAVGHAPSNTGVASVAEGTRVTRNWGGNSGPFGQSWTRDPVNKQTRDSLGLGRSNTGEFISHGQIIDNTEITIRRAKPWDGFRGGGDEVLVPRPERRAIAP